MKTHYCVVLDQEGQTPLHIAASAGHIQLVDALIQAGCDVTVQDFVSSIFFNIKIIVRVPYNCTSCDFFRIKTKPWNGK